MEDSSRVPTASDRPLDGGDAEDDFDDEDECCDMEAWETLTKSLKKVQSVLDHNRRLIQQVNDNHRSKIPYNLTKNVELIREINTNIATVVRLYSNLSGDFSGIVRQRRTIEADPKKVES